MRAKKLLAVACAAGYFFAANCRFVCAAGMPDRPVAAAEGSCHHQDDGDQPAPCCANHQDSIAVPLPAVVSIHDVSVVFGALPIFVSSLLLASPRLPAFWEDRGPPMIVSQILASSSGGPRAPPSSPVVL